MASSIVLDFVNKSKVDYDKNALNYEKLKKRLTLSALPSSRLLILHGLRGVGKTTALFQFYLEKSKDRRIYFHAQEIELLKLSLLEVIETAVYLFGENLTIFIDEISNLKNWPQQVKVAYDKFFKVNFLITGSSAVDLLKSKEVLARRAYYVKVNPLTFREYVHLKHGVLLDIFTPGKDLLKSAVLYDIYIKEKLNSFNLVDLVKEYTESNLPYLFENPKETLLDLVEKALFYDIAKAINLETQTIPKLERLVLILSASNKVTYENIAKDLEISKSLVSLLLNSLEQTGLIRRVYPYKAGKSIARKEWKYYFTVPMIRKLYAEKILVPASTINGNMLEDIFASNFEDIYFSEIDFVYKETLVEIGSANKAVTQMKKTDLKLPKIIAYNGLKVEQSGEITKIQLYIYLASI